MSLGIVIKSTEGLVFAADSRVTVMAMQAPVQVQPSAPGVTAQVMVPTQIAVTFDNASKILTFGENHKFVAAVTYGAATIGQQANDLRTAHGYLSEFEATLPKERIPVWDLAALLSDFYLAEWKKKMPEQFPFGMIFVVAGFNEGEPYGRVYQFTIPMKPKPEEQLADQFGINFGGQEQTAGRILTGFDPQVPIIINQAGIPDDAKKQIMARLAMLQAPIPVPLLALQDCINLADLLVKTTIAVQNLSVGVRGVGGATDVVVVTKQDGVNTIQKKTLSVEKRV